MEKKIYDLDYEISVLNQKHDVSRESLMEAAKTQGLPTDQIAEFVHVFNEFDLLSCSKEVLSGIQKMCNRGIKYDQEHRRGRKPTTTDGIIRSHIRREVAIQGITGAKIEEVLERPAGWYERISTGRQVLDLPGLVGIAVCLHVSVDSLFPERVQTAVSA